MRINRYHLLSLVCFLTLFLKTGTVLSTELSAHITESSFLEEPSHSIPNSQDLILSIDRRKRERPKPKTKDLGCIKVVGVDLASKSKKSDITITDLPVEVIFHIFSFVKPKKLWNPSKQEISTLRNIAKTCRLFRLLIEDYFEGWSCYLPVAVSPGRELLVPSPGILKNVIFTITDPKEGLYFARNLLAQPFAAACSLHIKRSPDTPVRVHSSDSLPIESPPPFYILNDVAYGLTARNFSEVKSLKIENFKRLALNSFPGFGNSLEELYLTDCRNSSPEIGRAITICFPNLKKFSINACWEFTENEFPFLNSAIEHLEIINGHYYSEALLSSLKYLFPNLKTLKLVHCAQLTDEILRDLPTDLTYLSLQGCLQLTDSGIENYLDSCTEFLELDISGTSIKGSFLGSRGCEKLSGLYLSQCENLLENNLSLLPRTLKKLNLSRNHQLNADFLQHLPLQLEELYIGFLKGISRKKSEGFSALRKLEKLKILSIVNTPRFYKAYKWVGNLPPNLTSLYYTGNNLTDAGLRKLKETKKDIGLFDFEAPSQEQYPNLIAYNFQSQLPSAP